MNQLLPAFHGSITLATAKVKKQERSEKLRCGNCSNLEKQEDKYSELKSKSVSIKANLNCN